MIISLDTETSGVDFVHGAMPYLVTTCADDGEIRFWEWPVYPLTRKPDVPSSDIQDIVELIEAADLVYLQNSKFDARALLAIGIQLPWPKVRDTLIMGHLLASNMPHDLTWMVMQYLGADIEPLELEIKEVTKACRAIAKRDYPEWLLADEGAPGMPSVKNSSKRDEDKPWKNDMWLPRALVAQWDIEGKPIDDDRWLTACSKYANGDSEHTLYLGLEMERLIRERGYWKQYEERLHLPRIACEMECYGVTAIGTYTDKTIQDYSEYVAEAGDALVVIAQEYGHQLELADGASINDNMRDFFYGSIKQECPHCNYEKRVKHWNGDVLDEYEVCPKCLNRKRGPMTHQLITTQRSNLGLSVIGNKKSGNASLDKEAMQEYLVTLDGSGYDFIKLLMGKRKRDTDLTYMEAYRRFWVQSAVKDYYRIHPSLNPCATNHLRWASNSPNLQNVGKQEDDCEDCDGEGCPWCNNTGKSRLSIRNCFGPLPDREWWSMDYQNIELRIPAYESGEAAMIELFEKSNDPPYFGSYHLLNASIIYPQEFWPLAEKKGAFKDRYKSTLYQYDKNGGFALQYGCGERKADKTFRVKGAYRLLKEKLPKIAALSDKYVQMAERQGYVTTLGGYPILASRTDDGRVLTTTPFNYHVSGSACEAKNRGLVRCSDQLAAWQQEGFDGHIALEIHDEILFDFPRGKTPDENNWRALELKRLMELSGNDIGIPCPVSVEYHDTSWAKGVAI